jgi:hypothetical protein
MGPNSMQLAWPFALIGAAIGAQLPTPFASGVILALVLALFGALISSGLPRVRDWQVALMAPFVGAATGATIGWSLDTFAGANVGSIAGTGFGLLALPPLILITDGARRAIRLPRNSILGQAQRRRVWLLTLATASLAALVVPALANPWSHPSEAPMAQLCALGTMMVALSDAMVWVAVAQSAIQPPTVDKPQSANPYRDGAGPKLVRPDTRMLSVLAAESLLYDALLVAVVAAALLVSR